MKDFRRYAQQSNSRNVAKELQVQVWSSMYGIIEEKNFLIIIEEYHLPSDDAHRDRKVSHAFATQKIFRRAILLAKEAKIDADEDADEE